MMKTILLSIGLSLVLLFGIVSPAAAQNPFGNDRVVFGNNVTLGENEKVNGDLVVFGGNVTIPEGAEVSSDLLVWGGNVTVEGTIGGDVAVFGGNVDVEGTGHIGGGVATFGGNANVADEAFVGGDVDAPFGNQSNPDNNNNRRSESFGSHASAPSFFGRVAGFAINTVWNIALLLGLALIAWLVAAFLPEHVQRVSDTVTQTPLVSFGMGLVTAALSLLLIIPMALLVVTICLAIVPIGFYTLLGVALLLGWIAIGQLIGDRLLTSMERPLPNFAVATVVGVVILTVVSRMPIIEIIPIIGAIFSFIGGVFGLIVALTGLGAVLLTRYGTQAYASGTSPLGGGGSGSYEPYTPPPVPPTRSTDFSREARADAELKAKIKSALAEAGEEDQPKPDEPEPEAPTGEPPADKPKRTRKRTTKKEPKDDGPADNDQGQDDPET